MPTITQVGSHASEYQMPHEDVVSAALKTLTDFFNHGEVLALREKNRTEALVGTATEEKETPVA